MGCDGRWWKYNDLFSDATKYDEMNIYIFFEWKHHDVRVT